MPLASPDNPVTAYESITVSTTAVGLTSATFGAADYAEATVEGAAIRVRLDGTDPTASEGHLLQVGDSVTLRGSNQLNNFSAIRDGSSDGTLRVSYYGG